MKHLKNIFESFSELSKDEILDNFLSINDELGEPTISTSKYGKLIKWRISWQFINLSHLQPLEKVADIIKNLGEVIVDIQSAASRFEDYNINISLSELLTIEITPKESVDISFEFIRNYESFGITNYVFDDDTYNDDDDDDEEYKSENDGERAKFITKQKFIKAHKNGLLRENSHTKI